MKNLILIGSPREKGVSSRIAEFLRKKVPGENEVLAVYDLKLSPCIHCDVCREKDLCPIQDNMQRIYTKIRKADNLLVITPVYFLGLPGPLKNLVDRTQVFWHHPLPKSKKAAVMMVGESTNWSFQEFFYKTWHYILFNIGVEKFIFKLWGKIRSFSDLPKGELEEIADFFPGRAA